MDSMILTTIVSSITALAGFIYGLKKQKQELIASSLDNIQKQILIYEQIIENLREEISMLIDKVEKQQEIIKHLEAKMEDCINKKTNL